MWLQIKQNIFYLITMVFFIFALCLVSACTLVKPKQIDLKGKVESVEIVSWDDKDIYYDLEKNLIVEKYFPMLKIVFSSPVELSVLSGNGMNFWCDAVIKDNVLTIKSQCTEVYLEDGSRNYIGKHKEKDSKTSNNAGNVSSLSGFYMYSVFVFLKWPTPYDNIGETPSYLLNKNNTYDLLSTRGELKITINGVKPFAHKTLKPFTFVISNIKLKEVIEQARKNGQLR